MGNVKNYHASFRQAVSHFFGWKVNTVSVGKWCQELGGFTAVNGVFWVTYGEEQWGNDNNNYMWQSHFKKERKVGAVKYGLKHDRSGDMCFSLNARERDRASSGEPRDRFWFGDIGWLVSTALCYNSNFSLYICMYLSVSLLHNTAAPDPSMSESVISLKYLV